MEYLALAWHWLFTNPIGRGMVAGVATAAVVDYGAFRTWKKWSDLAEYDWPTALFRWVQGAIVGALTGFGLNLGA